MDEPTTDLDPAGTQSVFVVARQLRERGVTLVLVEHETEDVTAADRVVVLADGVIVADGPPADVLVRSGWLEDHGIQPLGAAQLLECPGEPPVLTVEEAVARLRERGYRVSDDRWRHLLQDDGGRASSYGDPLIEVHDLEHRYPNGVVALERVDLTIHQGEFLAIIGQNGSGKTTLAEHFNGLLQPTAGEVRVAGRSTAGRSVQELSPLVGYVFSEP
jgi:energy-coupling factor transport system ATP-binding protein